MSCISGSVVAVIIIIFLFSTLCVWCMHACMCVGTQLSMRIHVHLEAWGSRWGLSLVTLPPYSKRQGLSTKPWTYQCGSSRCLFLGIPPPIFWDWNCRQTGHDTLAFKWVPVIWTPVLTCARQALNQGAISSASCLEKSMLLKTILAHPTDTIILLVKMSVLCKQHELWMCVNFINNHEVPRCTRLKIKDTSPRSKGTNVPTVLLDIHLQEPKIWGKEPLRACKDQSP